MMFGGKLAPLEGGGVGAADDETPVYVVAGGMDPGYGGMLGACA